MAESLGLSGDERVILHPGGRKILDLVEAEMTARNRNWTRNIGWARKTMSEIGNVSSPTAAFVFRESLARMEPAAGERGAFLVMGPGISVEALTFIWN
jgi:predicted naringenin-chalcone synthase